MANCPSCGLEIGHARSCDCGWGKKKAPALFTKSGDIDPALGYVRCDWMSGQTRCLYPGSMSTSTNGQGPWYCRAHFGCSNPIAGADIVDASKDYRHLTQEERLDRHQAQAEIVCRQLGLKTAADKRQWALKALRGAVKREPMPEPEPEEIEF